MKLINRILNGRIDDIVIDDNNNIIIVKCYMICIYDIKGVLKKSWFLFGYAETSGDPRRRVTYNDSEIFVLENHIGRVYVFSYEGELIRTWGFSGKFKPGYFVNPLSITINQNIVFISDGYSDSILTFTCCGKFISEYKDVGLGLATNIIIADDYVYSSNYEKRKISKFKLIYN